MLHLKPELLRFALVGSIGFLVDGGVMQLLTSAAGVSPLQARACSFPLALFATWGLNRTWTFTTGRHWPAGLQYRRYVMVQFAGFLINYACFAGLVTTGGLWRDWPLLALAVGTLVSMLFTYVSSRLFVFSARGKPGPDAPSSRRGLLRRPVSGPDCNAGCSPTRRHERQRSRSRAGQAEPGDRAGAAASATARRPSQKAPRVLEGAPRRCHDKLIVRSPQ